VGGDQLDPGPTQLLDGLAEQRPAAGANGR
jgi:hypothetical protein